LDLEAHLRSTPRPQVLSLVTNNVCNLRCGHCYLQVESASSSLLTEDEWMRVLASAGRLAPELLCFAGKEILATPVGPRLLAEAARLRNCAAAPSRLGLITNGTLLDRYRATVLSADISYLDISLDGLPADHDALRGKGAFERAWPNVLWAARTLGERFFINLTLQRRNVERLVEAVSFYRANGIRHVELGFYIPLPYTAEALALTSVDLGAVFSSFHRLGDLPEGAPIHVMMDLDLTTQAPLERFLRSEWFAFDRIVEDERGELFVPHDFGNGVTLEVRLAPYPVGITRSVRISAEGEYLAAEDTVDTGLYRSRRIGTLREVDLDVVELHRRALASGRIETMVRRFFAGPLPRLIRAANNAGAAQSRAA
jgi:hypothetical protein